MKLSMQQVQEQPKTQQTKTQQPANNSAKNEELIAFRPSAWPTVLSTGSKVCYTLAGASILLSIGIWNRIPVLGYRQTKQIAKGQRKLVKPTKEQYQESQKLGSFVGLWAPTFVLTAKALDDASERVAQYEFAQWEKKQVEKVRSAAFRSRFFGR